MQHVVINAQTRLWLGDEIEKRRAGRDNQREETGTGKY